MDITVSTGIREGRVVFEKKFYCGFFALNVFKKLVNIGLSKTI